MKHVVVPLAACLVAGIAPMVLSEPAASSDAPAKPPARAVTQLPDFKLPPLGTPATKRPPLVRKRGSLTYRTGLYDIHVLAVATADAPIPWDEAEARDQIAAADAWFDRETNGLLRFRLAGFQTLAPYPGSICDVDDAVRHARAASAALRRSPGATDVLPIVLTGPSGDDCPYSGMAYIGSPGTWVTAPDIGNGNETQTLIHELGHNFGLRHSATTVSADARQPWAPGADPEMTIYGDGADAMGQGGQFSCDVAECIFNLSGFHAHNRNLLGAIPADRITHIPMPGPSDEPATVIDLVDAGSSQPGFEVAYLPWLNRSKFFIEFRPARDGDAHINDEYGPGAGVYVRLIDTGLSSGPVPYPQRRWAGRFGTIGLTAGLPQDKRWVAPLGRGPGEPLTLPDGTLIEVLGVSGETASVRVTRPVDLTLPTMTAPGIEHARGRCRSFPCTVPTSAAKSGKYKIWLAWGALDDNQWVEYSHALVNGKRILFEERPEPDGTDEEMSFSPGRKNWGRNVILRAGNYTLEYSYRDLSGNVGTATYRLVLPRVKGR